MPAERHFKRVPSKKPSHSAPASRSTDLVRLLRQRRNPKFPSAKPSFERCKSSVPPNSVSFSSGGSPSSVLAVRHLNQPSPASPCRPRAALQADHKPEPSQVFDQGPGRDQPLPAPSRRGKRIGKSLAISGLHPRLQRLVLCLGSPNGRSRRAQILRSRTFARIGVHPIRSSVVQPHGSSSLARESRSAVRLSRPRSSARRWHCETKIRAPSDS